MSNNTPSIHELFESFSKVYDGPDRLQREHGLVQEAERLNIPLDTYRCLYELRGEEHIDPYPKPKNWRSIPGEWTKWVYNLPNRKKLILVRKSVVKLVQSSVVITGVVALGHYILEAPARQKQAHYQAWQMINSAVGQQGSGGRIEALQDLNKDGVSLRGLTALNANLSQIKLEKAELVSANLKLANFEDANFKGANFQRANLQGDKFQDANLRYVNLQHASLQEANFQKAKLKGANLLYANFQRANLNLAELDEANLQGAILRGAKNLTPEQVKKANNWESAHYDPEFRATLGLPPEAESKK